MAAGDFDGDGDLDVAVAPGSVDWLENAGGHASLDAVNAAPSDAQQGTIVPLVRVLASHRGHQGNPAVELARFRVRLEEAAGDPLSTAEARRRCSPTCSTATSTATACSIRAPTRW